MLAVIVHESTMRVIQRNSISLIEVGHSKAFMIGSKYVAMACMIKSNLKDR